MRARAPGRGALITGGGGAFFASGFALADTADEGGDDIAGALTGAGLGAGRSAELERDSDERDSDERDSDERDSDERRAGRELPGADPSVRTLPRT